MFAAVVRVVEYKAVLVLITLDYTVNSYLQYPITKRFQITVIIDFCNGCSFCIAPQTLLFGPCFSENYETQDVLQHGRREQLQFR